MNKFFKSVLIALAAIYIFLIGGIFGFKQIEPMVSLRLGFDFFFTTDEHGKTPRQKIENALGLYPHDEVFASDYQPSSSEDYAPVHVEGLSDRRAQPLVFIDPQKRQPGLTVINAALDRDAGLHGVLLLDERGQVLHIWPVDERYADTPSGRIVPHAVHVFRDGSIIVVNDFGADLARIDACGDPIWSRQMGTHHSISENDDGSFWTWDGDFAVRVDGETGEILQEFNLGEVIEANPEIDIYAVLQTDRLDGSAWMGDPLHANDIEALPAAMASAFPMFEPGDVVISMRSLNLLSVIDPDTKKVKWWRFGVGRRQHDPDWRPDGTILIFDNNTNRGYSRIRSISPSDYQITDVVTGESYDFLTARRGRQDVRDSGAIVVVSSYQGRVFELDENGEIVFEFVNSYDPDSGLVARVGDGFVLPLDYFDEMPSCDIAPG